MRVEAAGSGRVLDFDLENRPLSYWVPDEPTAQITAIAWMWVGEHDSLESALLGPLGDRDILQSFVDRYNEADIVTGHYIRRHDLPTINAMLYEQDMPLLSPKLVSDTKLDMFKKKSLPATQEFLLELLDPQCEAGFPLEKFHMTQGKWREANRLTPEGLELTKRRVMSDVHAHSHMRHAMLERGWLRGPSVWNPGGGFSEMSEGRIAVGEAK